MKEKNLDIKLDKRLLKALDELVEQGVYRDRNDAIRIAVSEKLHHLKQAGNVSEKPENEPCLSGCLPHPLPVVC